VGNKVDLTLRYEVEPDAVIVTATGDIDTYTAYKLSQFYLAINAEHGSMHTIVDMTEVVFIDSTGLGILVGILKSVWRSDRKRVVIVAEKRGVVGPFYTSGLSKIFSLCTSIAEAKSSLQKTVPSNQIDPSRVSTRGIPMTVLLKADMLKFKEVSRQFVDMVREFSIDISYASMTKRQYGWTSRGYVGRVSAVSSALEVEELVDDAIHFISSEVSGDQFQVSSAGRAGVTALIRELRGSEGLIQISSFMLVAAEGKLVTRPITQPELRVWNVEGGLPADLAELIQPPSNPWWHVQ
jgi:anti-sigma B factor antagonist